MNNTPRDRLFRNAMTQWSRRKMFYYTKEKSNFDAELSAREKAEPEMDLEDMNGLFEYDGYHESER